MKTYFQTKMIYHCGNVNDVHTKSIHTKGQFALKVLGEKCRVFRKESHFEESGTITFELVHYFQILFHRFVLVLSLVLLVVIQNVHFHLLQL